MDQPTFTSVRFVFNVIINVCLLLYHSAIICICKILLVTCVQLSVATLARLIGIDNHLPSSAHAGGKVCPNIFGARLIYF